MRKVFIPSLPTRFDAATQSRVPSLDLNPAAQFGELVKMVEGPVDKSNMQAAIDAIGEAAQEIGPDDLVLCVGDFVLAAACIAYANDRNGAVNVLRWDKARRSYDILEVEL